MVLPTPTLPSAYSRAQDCMDQPAQDQPSTAGSTLRIAPPLPCISGMGSSSFLYAPSTPFSSGYDDPVSHPSRVSGKTETFFTLIWAFHSFSTMGHHLVTLSLRLQFGFCPLVIYFHETHSVVLQQLIHATPLTLHLLLFWCLQAGVSLHISIGISATKPPHPHQSCLNHVRSGHNLEAVNFLWARAGNNFGNKLHGFCLAIQKRRGWKCLCVVANFRQQSL